MKRNAAPSIVFDSVRESLISASGSLLLKETIRVAGLHRRLSSALAPWRTERAVHDPGKVLVDVATAVALGGDCLADLACRKDAGQAERPWSSRSKSQADGVWELSNTVAPVLGRVVGGVVLLLVGAWPARGWRL